MSTDSKTFSGRLAGDRFIEIIELKQADDSVFSNYQRYDFYQLLWFRKAGGNSSYFLDFREYTLEDNQLVLIFPGQIDMLDTGQKEGYLFAIHSDVLFRINQHLQSDYLNGYYGNVFVSPDEETKEILEQLMRLIWSEYRNRNRIALMESYLEVFLFYVSSLSEDINIGKKKSDSLVSELMKVIDKNFITCRETEFYAQQFGMSNKTINEVCKKGTGKTVKQHIRERLILEIKKEIRLGKKNLKEIAFDLGFSEPAYFTRFFKQYTLRTPTEFRDEEHLSK
jgi:AraC-type DNA-binding domain-containing proteins